MARPRRVDWMTSGVSGAETVVIVEFAPNENSTRLSLNHAAFRDEPVLFAFGRRAFAEA
jgi:hypothetical protein